MSDKVNPKVKNATEKNKSSWNGRKILQKLSVRKKLQKNKVSSSETSHQTRNVQSKFRSIVAAARAVYRAPKFININLDTPRAKPAKSQDEASKVSKLTTNILQGNVKVTHEFDADMPSVNAICSNDSNEIWIGCWNRTPIRRLQCKEHIDAVEQYDTSVSDMTVMPSGDILFTKFGECAIKQISRSDGSITTFRGCMPLFPEGIHATKSGDILVTVVDETSFLVNKNTTRKVLKMTKSGKIINDIEYGNHGLKLFILPYRITENINGDICVVNRTGTYLGQIVVLDKNGDLKFTYDGNPSFPCNDFIPMGIACDNNGCIIISDPNDCSIHILDKSGILIQYMNTDRLGLGPPLSVCVDKTGYLWLGCMTEEDKQYNKSKIYTLC